MKKRGKQWVFIFADTILAAASIVAAVWLRFDGNVPEYYAGLLGLYCGVAAASVVAFGFVVGAYRSVFQGMDISQVIRQGLVCALSGGVFLLVKYCYDTYLVSGTITIIYCGLCFFLTVLVRAVPSIFKTAQKGEIRAVIIGAGTTGALTVRQLIADGSVRPVAIVDNDATKKGWYVEGVKIMGNMSGIRKIAKKTGAQMAILAIPSIGGEEKQRIFSQCHAAGLTAQMAGSLDLNSFLGDRKARLRDVSFDSIALSRGGAFTLPESAKSKRLLVLAEQGPALEGFFAELRASESCVVIAGDAKILKRAKSLVPSAETVLCDGSPDAVGELVSRVLPDYIYSFFEDSAAAEAAAAHSVERLITVETELVVNLQTRTFREAAVSEQKVETVKRSTTALKKKGFYMFLKRLCDIVSSFLGLLVLSAPMLLISVLILFDSKGPILFRQYRAGRNDVDFIIYKFRTMYINAPSDMATRLLENPHSYITPIGRFLRKTSLDELPQMFNILAGQMSVIGPRPLCPTEPAIALRSESGANLIRPGLTGLAQINGRDELSDEDKAEYDRVYLETIGLGTDIKIFFKTIWKVLRRDNIVEGQGDGS